MNRDQLLAAASGRSLICRDSLATLVWEMALADSEQHAAQNVWASAPIASLAGWLRSSWEAGSAGPDGERPAIISSLQSDRLWREIIRNSEPGSAVLGLSGLAGWARDARAGFHAFGYCAAATNSADWDPETAVFLDWNRRFQTILDANVWIDQESLLYQFNRVGPGDVGGDLLFLDPPDPTPELERLFADWRIHRGSVEILPTGQGQAESQHIVCADPIEEIRQAAEWAAGKLGKALNCRIAIVVPDLAARVPEVEELLQQQLSPDLIWHSHGRSIASIGLFGAATNAIRLLCGSGGFAALSRWLRSPFFGPAESPDSDLAARLELELRTDPRLQSGFLNAYRRDGLRQLIQSRMPAMAARLDAALEKLPRKATPGSWVQIWQDCLKALQWHGFDADITDSLRSSWDRAWSDFASVSAITGPLEPARAVEEFDQILTQQTIYRPPGLTGVHLFRDLASVGPGYAGVWVAGFDDQAWPPAGRRNPFLGARVQARCRMEQLRPEASFAQAEAELQRLLARVPEAVFSCPALSGDQPRAPNPRFADWQLRSIPSARSDSNRLAARVGSREFEQLADPAPEFTGEVIPRGVRTLDLQSRCPAIAFAVARLDAEPLELPVHGIGPRLRGSLVHRALELAYGDGLPTAETIDVSVDAAVAELLPAGDARWMAQVRAEKMRAGGLLRQLLEVEQRREDFVTTRVEHRFETRVSGRRLRSRLDRLDRLQSGSHLLIDYKTGRSSVSGWFGERLHDCQLPLYANGLSEPVGGIAIIALTDEGIRYQAVGEDVAGLAGRPVKMSTVEWQQQLQTWQQQIATLVQEFVAGDVRIDTSVPDRSGTLFAALIRSLEIGGDD